MEMIDMDQFNYLVTGGSSVEPLLPWSRLPQNYGNHSNRYSSKTRLSPSPKL